MDSRAVMADERVERKLAAILAADVAGYSRLMGEDEAGTRARLREQEADVELGAFRLDHAVPDDVADRAAEAHFLFPPPGAERRFQGAETLTDISGGGFGTE